MGGVSRVPACSECRIPFYIAAPVTTIDSNLADGSLIPIEERSPTEITHHQGKVVAAPGINVRIPGFRCLPAPFSILEFKDSQSACAAKPDP